MEYRSVLSRAAARLKDGFVPVVEYSKYLKAYAPSLLPSSAILGGSVLASVLVPDLVAHSYAQLFTTQAPDSLMMYTDSESYFADECIFAAVQGQGDTGYYMGIESPDGFSGGKEIETDPHGIYMDFLYCFQPGDDPAGDYRLFVGNDQEFFEKTVDYVP